MGEMGRRPTSGFPDVIVDYGYATVLYACMLYAGRKRPRRDYASLLRAPFSRTTLQRGRGPVLPHDPSRQIHKRTKPLFPILPYCILAALRGRIGRLSVPSPALLLLTVPFFLLVFSPCIMHHASWLACSPQTMRRSVPAPVTHQVTDHCEFNPWRSACCAEIRTVIFPRCCRRGRRPPRELMARTAITDSYAEASPNG